ncbi:PucR family transcriptional regulator [Amycolatopsis magusensis]|uniref:PucR family transcriptional regulator n=1 Tax=Amycolatopsis magusensis TaxID=882444 RepID=UPI0024A83B9D|nr:PucR family transcriptional regulator [Amycolatopsis magusensis]MDI5976512.1 PucR family transcriptional regulator [Amycolatopsis magusensis]
MALSLRQLAEAEGLRVLAGSAGLDRTIGWVHPTELLDPTAFLDGGELLLTTGLALDAVFGSYVDRLVAAGVAGIGFGSGVIHPRVPPGLVAAAESAGLPLLEVPRETPFIAITKAVSAAVAADEYATVVRTGRGQQELTRAAVGRGGPAAVVRRLARLVDGWVLLLDSGTPVEAAPAAARAHAAELEVSELRGTRGVRLPSGDEVVLHSLDARTVLAVGRPEPLDAADQFIVNTAASLLSLALQRNREQSGVLGQLRSGLLDLLLSNEDLGARTIRGLWPSLPTPPWRFAVVVGAAPARRAFADAMADSFCVARESMLVVVGADPSQVEPLARRLGLHAGLSPATAAPVAYRQAGQAAHAARARRVPLLDFEEYAGSGLLSLLPEESAALFAESLLSPLSADLVEALRCWLEEHGNNDAAATRLGIHRHTLRNRLRKVEALTGRNLSSPGVRAEFWVALSVAGAHRG